MGLKRRKENAVFGHRSRGEECARSSRNDGARRVSLRCAPLFAYAYALGGKVNAGAVNWEAPKVRPQRKTSRSLVAAVFS